MWQMWVDMWQNIFALDPVILYFSRDNIDLAKLIATIWCHIYEAWWDKQHEQTDDQTFVNKPTL